MGRGAEAATVVTVSCLEEKRCQRNGSALPALNDSPQDDEDVVNGETVLDAEFND
jgi:hypothetical protein